MGDKGQRSYSQSGGEKMATVTKVIDFWKIITRGKCQCGKVVKRPYVYCSKRCWHKAIDKALLKAEGKE
jgi:hypothetical protein